MGDGIFCLDCGQDKYQEAFNGRSVIIGHMGPQWWDDVAKVRNKRNGPL